MTSYLTSSEIPITQPYPDVIVDHRSGASVRVRARARVTLSPRVTGELVLSHPNLMRHRAREPPVPRHQHYVSILISHLAHALVIHMRQHYISISHPYVSIFITHRAREPPVP